MATVGVLLNGPNQTWHNAFIAALQTAYGAGNVPVRNGGATLAADAAALVANPVDVNVAADSPATLAAIAARPASSQPPIVMGHTSDPAAVPGAANLTGLKVDLTAEALRRFEMLRELLAAGTWGNPSPVGVIWNPNNPAKQAEFVNLAAAINASSGSVVQLPVTANRDFPTAFAAADALGVDKKLRSLIVLGDPLTVSNHGVTRAFVNRAAARIPSMFPDREAVIGAANRGLMSWGLNRTLQWQALMGIIGWTLAGSLPAVATFGMELVISQSAAGNFGVPAAAVGLPRQNITPVVVP